MLLSLFFDEYSAKIDRFYTKMELTIHRKDCIILAIMI